MKNKKLIGLVALTAASGLIVSQAVWAAPLTAPPTPNTPDATFNSVVTGQLSNTKVTSETNPTCKNNGGVWNGGSTCAYPVLVPSYGGIAVTAIDPELAWDYAKTLINGYGIDIFSTTGKGLNVHAQDEIGLYHGDLSVTSAGLKYSNFDTDAGNYSVSESLDTTNGLDTTRYTNITNESFPDPGDNSSWQRGVYLNLTSIASKIQMGARYISLGNYRAATTNGAAVYTEKVGLDNEANVATLNMKVKANGFGKIYTKTAAASTPLTAFTGGSTGYASAYVACNDTVNDRLLSCAIHQGPGYAAQADTYYGTASCTVYAKNVAASATSFTPTIVCFDPNGIW